MGVEEKLEFGSLVLTLELLRPKEILPHEDTIPKLTTRLMQKIEADGVQLDPILVDQSSKVILDGMHRHEALLKLGCRRILACGLNYSDDSVKIFRWVRCWQATSIFMQELIEQLRLSKSRSRLHAIREVDGRRASFAILTNDSSYVSSLPHSNTLESYTPIRDFDRVAEAYDVHVQTFGQDEALSKLGESYSGLLYPAPLEKRDVVQSGLNRKPFPAKSTRHVIPVRPMGVGIPLETLRSGAATDAESQQILSKLLAKSYRVLEPGSRYRGRTYQDTLIVFAGLKND